MSGTLQGLAVTEARAADMLSGHKHGHDGYDHPHHRHHSKGKERARRPGAAEGDEEVLRSSDTEGSYSAAASDTESPAVLDVPAPLSSIDAAAALSVTDLGAPSATALGDYDHDDDDETAEEALRRVERELEMEDVSSLLLDDADFQAVLRECFAESATALGATAASTETLNGLMDKIKKKWYGITGNKAKQEQYQKKRAAQKGEAADRAEADAAYKRAKANIEEKKLVRKSQERAESDARKAARKGGGAHASPPPAAQQAPLPALRPYLVALQPAEEALAVQLAAAAGRVDAATLSKALAKAVEGTGANRADDWFTAATALANALVTVRVAAQRVVGSPIPRVSSTPPTVDAGTAAALAKALSEYAAALRLRGGASNAGVALERGGALGTVLLQRAGVNDQAAVLRALDAATLAVTARATQAPANAKWRVDKLWQTEVTTALAMQQTVAQVFA
jgi:hypothetical protein